MFQNNSIDNNINVAAVLATQSADHRLEGFTHEELAEKLSNESDKYSVDANQKRELAQQYLQAANSLDKMADAVRLKAQQLRNKEIEKDKAIDSVTEIIKGVLEFPIPRDATPELLEQIADALEAKARENRVKADDLLIDAEEEEKLSKELKEQAGKIAQKDMNFSDLRLRAIVSHNEGLKMVLEKLGILRLEAQLKQYIEEAEKKSQEQSRST